MDLSAVYSQHREWDRPRAYRTHGPQDPRHCPSRETAPAKSTSHTNLPVKHTVPSTPLGKKAPVKKASVKTKPAAITVKGKACRNLARTDNMFTNLYAARQKHLPEFTVGNVPAKGPWKLVLEIWKEFVDDDGDPDMMIMLATIEAETKHPVNKWAKINGDAKAYIQNGNTTKSCAAAIPEPKYFDLFMMPWAMKFVALPLQETKVSRAGAIAQDEAMFGANKESEVEPEDRKNHTGKDNNKNRILNNEIKGDKLVDPGQRIFKGKTLIEKSDSA
ncbi:hypothetical protein BDK51DRAFT_40795 [Blyttiomyces helicus]|uniref:Uncharacterized protein n=1 Tax=Blyttiomyces helicus TaxID=388810 RepID=A0A4P9WI33_9FUNG|nr:hypothetical protein BDK51DRAFT_40795 [Blyttiomyces helicus]|eukprot:RKO92414.1 hypothetical protein BDK51DRAFT_40795 [Blyttiomyces helicus]